MNELVGKVDLEKLQQKADEYAQKGAESVVEEFYSGYNSPYKKKIKENLEKKAVDTQFAIPDIIAVLNDKFSQEVDQIANTAIAKTYIPLVKEFLTREDAEIKFSDILSKFIDISEFKNSDDLSIDDYSVEKINDSSILLESSFFQYQITNGKIGYELRFYKTSKEKTTIMALPYLLDDNKKYRREYEIKETMKLSLDGGATLELPFTKGILEDRFISYIARLVIGENHIIFDVENFDEDMFPRDECHC